MAFIACSFNDGTKTPLFRCTNFSGQVYRFLNHAGITPSYRRIHLPPATIAMRRAPSGDNYGNRQYLVGGHSGNLLVDVDTRCVRQSIPAPDELPVVSVGAGSTPQICYTRFYDERTDERSPLSEGLSVTGNITRAWSQIPTEVPNERVLIEGTCSIGAGAVAGSGGSDVLTNYGDLRPGDRIAISTDLTRWATIRSISSFANMVIDDTGMAGVGVSLVARCYSRVSHVELWVSVSGGLPRLAVRVRIGTPAVTESTPTLALGQAETQSFGAMPRGEFNLMYNDRQLVAGVDEHRDIVYLSAIGFPERFEGLAFKTAYNEPIVGMFKYRDYVVLLCPDSSYKLQGYTEDDTVRTVLEPDIGGFGHHGNRIAEGRALVPGRKGMMVFNGAFHPAIPTRLREWKAKSSNTLQGRLAYEDGFACVNPNDETYRFFPNLKWYAGSPNSIGKMDLVAPTTVTKKAPIVWVGQYNTVAPEVGGAVKAVEWLNDSPITPDDGYTTYASYLVNSGEKTGRLYHGNNKGKVYVEGEETAWSGSDCVIVTAHLLMGDPGGGRQGEGKRLIRIWPYVLSELSAGVVNVWPGDEYSYPGDVQRTSDGPEFPLIGLANSVPPTYTGVIKATRRLNSANKVFQPEITRQHTVEIDGRGYTFEFRWTGPKRVVFLGVGGVWVPGTTSRPLHTTGVPPI